MDFNEDNQAPRVIDAQFIDYDDEEHSEDEMLDEQRPLDEEEEEFLKSIPVRKKRKLPKAESTTVLTRHFRMVS